MGDLGMGSTALFLIVILYIVGLALTLWIGYAIMKAAVKNGILAADHARANPVRRPNI